jgi:hypothetical protein
MGAAATWAGRSSRGLNCEDQRGTAAKPFEWRSEFVYAIIFFGEHF